MQSTVCENIQKDKKLLTADNVSYYSFPIISLMSCVSLVYT